MAQTHPSDVPREGEAVSTQSLCCLPVRWPRKRSQKKDGKKDPRQTPPKKSSWDSVRVDANEKQRSEDTSTDEAPQ